MCCMRTLAGLSRTANLQGDRSPACGDVRAVGLDTVLYLLHLSPSHSHSHIRPTIIAIPAPHDARLDDPMNDAQPGPSDYTDSSPSSPRPSDISQGKRPVQPHPQNLRFQRRTSERAFLEGSYREGPPTPRMDYSASAGFAGGSSPWASSPEASRQSFGDANVSREDLPPPAVSNAGEGIERPGSGWEQEQQKTWQPQSESRAPQQPQQEYQADGQRSDETESRRPQSAARYHGAPPHHAQQQQRQPQYKLQAKITGLERTGKKDAILRFDVYVRQLPAAQSTRQRAYDHLDKPS